MRKGIYGLRVKIRKRKRLLHETTPRRELTERPWANKGQKCDHLRNDAAARAASSGINGRRGDGFSLGRVRGEGEERSEGIHCCVCVCGLRDALNLSEAKKLILALLLYLVSLS